MKRVDYYALFGVDRGASADAIRAAFHAFARRYHPDRHAGASALVRERAAAIYRRGTEGYRVLMNPESRRRYDAALAGKKPESPSQGRVRISSPRARPFAVRAQEAHQAGDYKAAKLNLKLALQHDPGNARLEALLADVERKLRGG